jgi:hypothetical protein
METVMHRFAIATAIAALALPVGASAAQTWEDISNQTAIRALDSAPLVTGPAQAAVAHLSMQPDAGGLQFITNFVAAGPAQGGVPCFNCVQGAQTTFNIGLTGPYHYVLTGKIWQYVLAFTDDNNTANCTLSWAITSGAKVIDSFSYVATGLQKNGGYLYGFNRNPPSPAYRGPAVLSGKVACGTKSQTVKSTLFFQ